MAEELGKIEKPEVNSFVNKKKLFLVPLIYSGEESPAEYIDLFNLYWNQVAEQLANLESRIGKINRIYHESLNIGGEDAMKILEQMNAKSYGLVAEKVAQGVSLDIIEDKDLVEESVDWERCLLIGLISEKVTRTVYDAFMTTTKKRYEHITKRINDTLKAGEVALLFIREGHMVQFPSDLDVFHVSPPALNEIHRWLRNRREKQEAEKAQ